MTIASGAYFFTLSATPPTISAFLSSKIVAAHARLARQAAGDDDDIRTGVIGGIVRALDVAVEVLQAGRLQHVERLALRHALDDVVQDDVAQFLFGQTLGRGGPDKTGSDNRDFHTFSLKKPIPSVNGCCESTIQGDRPRKYFEALIGTGRRKSHNT